MTREQELEAEVERLKHIVGEMMRPDLALRIKQAVRTRGIKAARILAMLLPTHEGRTREAIWAAVFQHPNGDGPEIKIVDVQVSQLRSDLRAAKAPGNIECVWGWGYRLTPELRAWLRDRVEMEAAA